MALLKLSLEHMHKNDVSSILKPFKNLMLKALDFRNLNHNKIGFSDIEKIENSCDEAFSVFIPKMTEITFRPLFYKVWLSINLNKIKSELFTLKIIFNSCTTGP